MSENQKNQEIFDFTINHGIIFIIIVFFLLMLLISVILGDSNTSTTYEENGNKSMWKTIGYILIVILLILFIYNIVKNVFGVSVNTDITPKEADINININPSAPVPNLIPSNNIPVILYPKQVFNIPGNYYNYNEAKSLCKAYNAELATYNQIENTYNKGGEWCNYGWSDGQMALFPTQKKTFDTLQGTEGHEHDCGRPGVNGGYIANPAIKFGVNCYGYKPKINQEEEDLLKNMTPYPKSNKDILMEKQVNYWQNKLGEILVSPFNYNRWSMI
jgi:hypothetical protein